jgi:hypothetical protein
MKTNFSLLLLFLFFSSIGYSQIRITVSKQPKTETVKNFTVTVVSRTTSRKETFNESMPSNYFQIANDSIFDFELSIGSKKYLFKGIEKKYLLNTALLSFEVSQKSSANCCQTIYYNIEILFIGSRKSLEYCNDFNKLSIITTANYKQGKLEW